MRNGYFTGFRVFCEEKDDDGDKFVATVKKQLGVPKHLWLGMPVVVSNAKIGGHMISDPTVFYVTDFDDEEVTIKNVAKPGDDPDEEEDDDEEIDIGKDNIHGELTFTMARKHFYKLLVPDIPPDGGMGGGMGGLF